MRLALAMLVCSSANVLLLDEPTNNLDPASRTEVLSAIKRYPGAVVLVTHDEGAVDALHPDRVLVVRYEDLRADTVGELGRIARFLGIEGATQEVLEAAAAASTKSAMARRDGSDGKRPAVVRDDARPARTWYRPEDSRFLDELFRRHLKHDFGYARG